MQSNCIFCIAMARLSFMALNKACLKQSRYNRAINSIFS
ncbi:hypothetical protein PTRA_a1078 [Pseudoalteromonas translucida KMM 520]|uniref:Uncharacterized protein n=1 Tax=Pseudoalteromonas translucida KMM 520 TaxID=1315283 RepID=A0A0U2WVL7_9GAMM|nr:hypothetical protein PTRA_a1078 [Pseudoalteromonas translucida KMM 520]